MSEWSGPDGEPSLADVQREFPFYECWRATSGLYYARRPGRPRRHKADAVGEDPRDLRDQIIRDRSHAEEDQYRASIARPASEIR